MDALQFASRILTHLADNFEDETGVRSAPLEDRAQVAYRLLHLAEAGCDARVRLQADPTCTLAPVGALREGAVIVDAEGLTRIVIAAERGCDGSVSLTTQYEYVDFMPSRPKARADRFPPDFMLRVSELPARGKYHPRPSLTEN